MKKNLAISSILPTLFACIQAPTQVEAFSVHPTQLYRSHQYRSLKIRASKTVNEQPPEQEDVDDESNWYAPPDFTVEDEHLFDEDKARKKYMPPDWTVEGDDEDEDTAIPEPVNVIKEESVPVSKQFVEKERSPVTEKKRPAKEKPAESRQATSWMEKNANFAPDQRAELERPTKKQPEKQERKRDDRSGRNNRTFRQDFRGTRVFVQGLTPETSWQTLKDHFRLAGEVVFASVSVDVTTGRSKGCGVVQFETTEMAQNAIAIMRNHPLDGATLYVREDVQEREGATLRSPRQQGDKKSTIPMSWSCADKSAEEMLSEDEKTAIFSLIRARDDARKRRNYDASDDMREELKLKFGVHLDDRLKMWWVSHDGRRVPQSISDSKGDGRWGSLKPWRQISTTPENDACVNPDLVNGLLAQRDVARREKDFATADSLLDEARIAPDGDLNLRIHDESRTWRIWTEKSPPRELMYGKQKEKKTPAEQCLDIVNEHAPEKLSEIETMLEKFPGREWTILKKLQKRYLKQ